MISLRQCEGGCRAPAVRGWTVCRFHGAGGGDPASKRNGMYRHGRYTKEAIAVRRKVSAQLREVRGLLSGL